MSLSILYVAPDSGTSRQRANALKRLGSTIIPVQEGIPDGWRFQIYRVGSRLHRPPDLVSANHRIVSYARERQPDLLWVDKGLSIRPETLKAVRRDSPDTMLVAYSPDDCRLLYKDSAYFRRSISLYDIFVTTKSYNVEELRAWGASNVLFIDNAYCPNVHRPLRLSEADLQRFQCDVGFVGFYEKDRARMMLELARRGVSVVARGPAWNRLASRHPNLTLRQEFLGDEDYPKAINATAINLGFLRKQARDLQTTRSIEIPGCGGFLLAERTTEHQALFEEGREAEFFEGFDELFEKCLFYLAHPDKRRQIALAGLKRCSSGGYSNDDRLAQVLRYIDRSRIAIGRGALP